MYQVHRAYIIKTICVSDFAISSASDGILCTQSTLCSVLLSIVSEIVCFFIWITSPYPSELLHWYSVRKSREIWTNKLHYSNVIMSAMAFQITGVWIVCSTVCSGADQRKHQSYVSLAFVMGIHRWRVGSPHKGPVTRKMFPFDDTIMMIINGICCVIDYHSTSIHREKNINKLFASGTISAQDIRQFRKIGFLFILIYTLKQLLNERSYFSYSKQHFIQIWYLYQSFIYIYI